MKQREENYMHSDRSLLSENETIPAKMKRKYCLFITYKDRKPNLIQAISEINSTMIGALTIIKGIVIRTDEVKPRLSIGTFTCDVCGCENYMEILDEKFTPLQLCQSQKCRENRVNGKLTFLPKHSYFVPSQEISIQEVPEQLRQGNIPRNLKLILTDTNIKKAHPGDIIEIEGVVVSRKKERSRYEDELIFEAQVEAYKITNFKKKYVDMVISE